MPVSFSQHLARIAGALDRRTSITEDIERQLLNVQGKPIARERDRSRFEYLLAMSFNRRSLPSSGGSASEALEAAHVADGFEPVRLERQSHQFDPLELIARAYEHWEMTRWPGRAARLALAHVIFAAFVTRQLELLGLRAWDEGQDQAESRLRAIQELLDRLNQSSAAPPFVRDVRWLVQTAQGPLTRHLGPYFAVAERIASLPASYRLEIHKAGAMLASGHLRSQLRYRAAESGLPLDAPQVLAVTRNSNSMDVALLVGDLVPLLEAYADARRSGNADARVARADAILQGLSADPALLLTRLDLLGPCTTIEEVFIARDAGSDVGLSAPGERHRAQLAQYHALVCHLAPFLRDDFAALNPRRFEYSPLGIAYGFCADLFYNIAGGVLAARPRSRLTVEDVFDGRANLAAKVATADAWQTLPRRPGEREHFTHSSDWAAVMFERVMSALERRVAAGDAPNASSDRTARLRVVPAAETSATAVAAQEHVVTSDIQGALATGATAFPRGQFLNDRREARFLASAEVDGKWFGVSKVIVSAVLAQGRDAVIRDIPEPVIDVLKLTCPDLVDR